MHCLPTRVSVWRFGEPAEAGRFFPKQPGFQKITFFHPINCVGFFCRVLPFLDVFFMSRCCYERNILDDCDVIVLPELRYSLTPACPWDPDQALWQATELKRIVLKDILQQLGLAMMTARCFSMEQGNYTSQSPFSVSQLLLLRIHIWLLLIMNGYASLKQIPSWRHRAIHALFTLLILFKLLYTA